MTSSSETPKQRVARGGREIEGEAEQQSLARLRGSGSTGSAAGELALDSREDTLDRGTAAVFLTWEVLAHLLADACCTAACESLSGDDAAGLQLYAAEGVVAFGIELGIGGTQPIGAWTKAGGPVLSGEITGSPTQKKSERYKE